MKSVLLVFALIFSVIQQTLGFQCYVGRIGGPTFVQQCPVTSQGCIKLVLYQSNGYEQVEKLCADEERPGFSYNEGCDTISVPFKQRECYCKENLCNSASHYDVIKKEFFVTGIILAFLTTKLMTSL